MACAMVVVALGTVGCGGTPAGSDASVDAPTASNQDAMGGSDAAAMAIPDPGAATAMFQSWIVPAGTDVSSPSTAHRVGVATQSPDYVEATTGANGNAFYVFRAGPALTMFRVNQAPQLELAMGDFMHLHRGASMMFGAEVMATMSTAAGATWPVTPGEVYVLEVHRGPGVMF